MKFCADCDSRLVQNMTDVGGPGICPRCNPEKAATKNVIRGFNHSRKTRRCSKGCGADIYWDETFKSDSGKFIPMDAGTDMPHTCDSIGVSGGIPYMPETKTVKNPAGSKIRTSQARTSGVELALPDSLLYDIRKIPRSELDDPIIHQIIQGHKEESLALIHYENLVSPEPDKVPIDSMGNVLSKDILDGLKRYGFSGLLPFQAESIRLILQGRHLVISAPTGSGKTEAFAVPILQKILKNPLPGVAALLVYPLNALIDDQASKISDLIAKCNLQDKIAAYSIHGGQSTAYKDKILSESGTKPIILATNFDFINYHLILQDKKWRQLFRDAKILVVDEAHSYTSFHGSNVYHVIKRMRRYMKDVQFVGSSATLDNSQEFFSEMFDLPKDSFSYVASKSGRMQNKHLFFIMPRKFGQRITMEMLASLCFKNNTRQLVFSNTHNDAELLASNVENANSGIRIQIHRGGLEQSDRKLHETQMKLGDLDALSCTPTLELGIDIGHVDAVISAFKNEYDSFVQRIGRAGRMGQKSYAICVFDPEDAACHYFARHMPQYLGQEHVVQINRDNPIIADKHTASWGIEQHAAMESDKSQFFDFANSVNLRGSSEEVAIHFGPKKIGTRDAPVGYYQLHQNAIYRFNKQNYEVDSITKTKSGAAAYLKKSAEFQKITMPAVRTVISKVSEDDAVYRKVISPGRHARTISLRFGLIDLDKTITGYLKGNYNDPLEKFETFSGGRIPSWKDFRWHTMHSALGITLPPGLLAQKPDADAKGAASVDSAVHTVTHVLVNAGKIITKSESNDIGSYYDDGVIYLYDNTSDGYNGCSQMIFENFGQILQTCHSLLHECDCSEDKTQKGPSVQQDSEWGGCPKCTYTTSYCQTKNRHLLKADAKAFFDVFRGS